MARVVLSAGAGTLVLRMLVVDMKGVHRILDAVESFETIA